MTVWFVWLGLVLVCAYLLGSIPTGYIVGRLLKGIDIRQFGSGSTGATNVLRTLGKGPGLLVLIVDIAKGVLAIALTRLLYASVPAAAAAIPAAVSPVTWVAGVTTLAGLMVLLGHSRSIWINFTGGKSVASGLGVLLALSWQTGLVAIAVFATVLAISRIVSLSSIITAAAVPVAMLLLHQPLPYVLFGIAAAAYVISRHRTNIQRLLAGTEPRLGQKPMNPEANQSS
ncbi:MAG: glycerol-3-phosphate 1-O-acyltransferase PlsY [Synechococcales bacterium]|nr:glycerol-3-phosphate 1-O-acyltransferase PlsY [Synechococcales bacterium]